MRTPVSTYRLQITPEFDLFEAARRLPYLHDLGVDWVYLSPLLASEPGSQHGYDVVAFDHVDPQRGGAEGLATLSEDPWWWDVLRLGRESEHAVAFDVDWAAGDGRILLPVVGDGDEGST